MQNEGDHSLRYNLHLHDSVEICMSHMHCCSPVEHTVAIGRSAAPQEVYSMSDYQCKTNNSGNVCINRPVVALGLEVVTKLYNAVNVRNLCGQASSSFNF